MLAPAVACRRRQRSASTHPPPPLPADSQLSNRHPDSDGRTVCEPGYRYVHLGNPRLKARHERTFWMRPRWTRMLAVVSSVAIVAGLTACSSSDDSDELLI